VAVKRSHRLRFSRRSFEPTSQEPFVERLRQFGRNAGVVGVIQTIAVFGLFAYSIRLMPTWDVRWPFLAIILGGWVLGYAVRNLLVNHVQKTGPLLSFAAYGIVGSSLLYAKGLLPRAPYIPFLLVCLTAVYMGCYFWMMSDSRITTET
jgi:hypothetical protein